MNRIIYCKDCKYCDSGLDEQGVQFYKCLAGHSYGGTMPMDFCSHAVSRKYHKLLTQLHDTAAFGLAYNFDNIPIKLSTLEEIIEILEDNIYESK